MNKSFAFSLLALAVTSTSAFALDIPDRIRGPLSNDIRLRMAQPIQVATCPPGFNEVFANQQLSCVRRITHVANVQCPSAFPNYTARNAATGSDRDLCAKAGVNLPSTGALTGVTLGVDFVRVPLDGTSGSTSFVAGHPNATEVNAQGWRLNTSNADGITDRYQRTFVIKATPILVAP